jgi:hypothetical protein
MPLSTVMNFSPGYLGSTPENIRLIMNLQLSTNVRHEPRAIDVAAPSTSTRSGGKFAIGSPVAMWKLTGRSCAWIAAHSGSQCACPNTG